MNVYNITEQTEGALKWSCRSTQVPLTPIFQGGMAAAP